MGENCCKYINSWFRILKAEKTADDADSSPALTARLAMDGLTFTLIKGSTIDYKEEMIRSSFEIVSNPQAELGCSCGTSFALKDSVKI